MQRTNEQIKQGNLSRGNLLQSGNIESEKIILDIGKFVVKISPDFESAEYYEQEVKKGDLKVHDFDYNEDYLFIFNKEISFFFSKSFGQIIYFDLIQDEKLGKLYFLNEVNHVAISHDGENISYFIYVNEVGTDFFSWVNAEKLISKNVDFY